MKSTDEPIKFFRASKRVPKKAQPQVRSGSTRNQRDFEVFANLFTKLEEMKEVRELFEVFLTQDERRMLGDRLCVIAEILEGNLAHRQIAKKLQLSISRITAGSKAVQKLPTANKAFLMKKIEEARKTQRQGHAS